MTRYLISFDDGSMDHIPAHEIPEVAQVTRAAVRDAIAAGVWVFGAGMGKQQARVVATDGTVTAGPFPETKAVLGGFAILELPSLEDALKWAARFASGCRCAQEVRELLPDPEVDALRAQAAEPRTSS